MDIVHSYNASEKGLKSSRKLHSRHSESSPRKNWAETNDYCQNVESQPITLQNVYSFGLLNSLVCNLCHARLLRDKLPLRGGVLTISSLERSLETTKHVSLGVQFPLHAYICVSSTWNGTSSNIMLVHKWFTLANHSCCLPNLFKLFISIWKAPKAIVGALAEYQTQLSRMTVERVLQNWDNITFARWQCIWQIPFIFEFYVNVVDIRDARWKRTWGWNSRVVLGLEGKYEIALAMLPWSRKGTSQATGEEAYRPTALSNPLASLFHDGQIA